MDEMIRRAVTNKNIIIEMHLAKKLEMVKAGKNYIELILLNLVINSRDAMPNGGHLIIETSDAQFPKGIEPPYTSYTHPDLSREYIQAVWKCWRCVLMSVSDTGCGMTKEVLARLYEPFFTTKERHTGLGLSATYGSVKQLGGFMTIYSEQEKGTKVDIYLPSLLKEFEVDD